MTAILDIPAADYHADLIDDKPSLSSSIAHILCTASPAHARAAHPRLNPRYRPREEEAFDIGTAAHAMILEGRDAIVWIEYDNWRTNAAKEERDAARAAGKIPLLSKVAEELHDMVNEFALQLSSHLARPIPFTGGKSEQTLVWEEDGVLLRARIDWLHDGGVGVDDLKTTGRSASPDAYSRALFGIGGDVQAAMYRRGVKAVTGWVPEFRWVVVETTQPYALSVISPAPDLLALGEAKVEYAIDLWRECMRLNEWPGFPNRVCYADLPGFEEERWLEKVTREGVK